jgi:hypothetical protein
MSSDDSKRDLNALLESIGLPPKTPRDLEECACGDYRYQHRDGHGKCGVCGDSRAPYDGCTRFRLRSLGESKDSDSGKGGGNGKQL